MSLLLFVVLFGYSAVVLFIASVSVVMRVGLHLLPTNDIAQRILKLTRSLFVTNLNDITMPVMRYRN